MNQFDNQEPNWGNINITDKEMFNQLIHHQNHQKYMFDLYRISS